MVRKFILVTVWFHNAESNVPSYFQTEQEALEEMKKQDELKRKWAATRDNRVCDWKEFKVRLEASKFDFLVFLIFIIWRCLLYAMFIDYSSI